MLTSRPSGPARRRCALEALRRESCHSPAQGIARSSGPLDHMIQVRPVRLHHRLGFLFHSRPHPGGPGVSDISSAGIGTVSGAYGKTCRQNVLRRVDVPVVPGAAGRALPRPGVQAQRREQMPARRAGFRRRIPAVDHHEVPPVPLALVLQLAAELTPPAVADGLGQPAVADHVLDGQVLDHDDVVAADEAGAGAVEEVLASATDFPVGAGDLGLLALARFAEPFRQRARRRW